MGQFKFFFREYWFWLAVTFIHRLFSIMQPPLEMAHNWRQTTVNMVARNFLEVDANIFFPRVDMAGELSGITGMEFPLLNYLIYLVSLVFGYEHWFGRLINLVLTTLGLWCFYDYLKRYFNPRIAFNTGMVLLFSLFYYYSRKIMPDTFGISLIFIGLWFWSKYIRTNRFMALFTGFGLILLGVLSKLPSVVVLAFVWPMIFQASFSKKTLMIALLAIVGIASATWYFYWVPHLEAAYGYQHFFMGQTIGWTASFLAENWTQTLFMFYNKAAGFSGFFVFVIGLFFIRTKRSLAWLIVISSTALFLAFMLKSGSKFTDHEYYIIPFIALMAFVGAFFLSRLPRAAWAILLLAIAVEGVARKWEDQFVKRSEYFITMEDHLFEYIPPSDLIVINSDEYPTPLYFAHRKGWLASNKDLQDQAFVNDLKAKGCNFIVVLKKRFGKDIGLNYSLIYDSEEYSIYQL
jgi:hypothetical protein